MSIELFQFINANLDGEKEAVIVPNTPSLINKLSAAEANRIRSKINEILGLINLYTGPVPYGELRPYLKGIVGGVPNTSQDLEVGDIVQGFATESDIWAVARYEGGDPENRDNYTPLSGNAAEPQLFTATTTGLNQNFILDPPFVARSVFKSKGILFKGSEWVQNADTITILVNTNINNTIYVEP